MGPMSAEPPEPPTASAPAAWSDVATVEGWCVRFLEAEVLDEKLRPPAPPTAFAAPHERPAPPDRDAVPGIAEILAWLAAGASR